MADTQFTGYSKTAGDPTVYGTTSGGQTVAFENADQAFKSGVSNDFSNVKTVASVGASTPYSTYFPQAVSVNPPAVVPATSLVGDQVTAGDVKDLVNSVNQNYVEQQKALKLTPEELAAGQRRTELTQQLRNLDTEQMQRQVSLEGQPGDTGQAIVGRQVNQLAKEIAYRRLPLVNEVQAQTDIIAQYQAQRDQTLKGLELGLQQGQFNLGLAKDYQAQQQAEAQAVKDTIAKAGITARYAEINGTVYDAATGKALSLSDFQKVTGQKVGLPSNQTNFSMVEGVQQAAIKTATQSLIQDLASKYFDAGVLLTDDITTAMNKIKAKSAIYREQVRPPSSGGGTAAHEQSLKDQMNSAYGQIVDAWSNKGYIQGNGKISSKDYINAKNEWNRTFSGQTSNPGQTFDDLFGSYIDRSGSNYEADYGLNKVPASSF